MPGKRILIGKAQAFWCHDPGAPARLDRQRPELRDQRTASVVQEFFAALGARSLKRFEVPNFAVCNFLLAGVLGDGGSRPLRIRSRNNAGTTELEIEIAPQRLKQRLCP